MGCITPQTIFEDEGIDIFDEAMAMSLSDYPWMQSIPKIAWGMFRHAELLGCPITNDLVQSLSDRIDTRADDLDRIDRTYKAFVNQSEGDEEEYTLTNEDRPDYAEPSTKQYLKDRQIYKRKFTQRVTPYEIEAMERVKGSASAFIRDAWGIYFNNYWSIS